MPNKEIDVSVRVNSNREEFVMKNLAVLCPDCLHARLTVLDNENAVCKHCNHEFIVINKNTVRYK